MTLMEMINEGAYLYIAGMCALFVLWVIMITRIGTAGKAADKKEAQTVISTNPRNANSGAVTAAITAAVTEFRKKK